MEKRNNSILVALNDSISSRDVIDYLINLSLCPEDCSIYLLHFFRKTPASIDLMGKKFTEERPSRMLTVLQKAKERLIGHGFYPDKIKTKLITDVYPTVSDGIIDRYKKGDYNLVVIGRKEMSKAEEFVMGDISIKLIRALEGSAILVVKSK